VQGEVRNKSVEKLNMDMDMGIEYADWGKWTEE
jgi:hypothetical protein